MKSLGERMLGVFPSEAGAFWRAALLFFGVFFCFALFRNYVDAAFLKRYGPHHIPGMLLLNGILSLALFGLCRRLARKRSDDTMLGGFLVIFGLAQAALFLGVRARAAGAYPVLFQLLYLADAFLLVYLWNVVQGLFDARQGKRLFRLLMGAQVLGSTLGSLAARPLAGRWGADSPLLVCAAANVLIALTLARFWPGGSLRPSSGAESPPTRPAAVFAAFGRYPIFRFLCACALIPNLLLPILTYQFGLLAEAHFPSETGLMNFLSWFRAATTLSVFAFILGLSGLHAQLSPRLAALAPPLNQCLVFGALAGGGKLLAAAYGQFSYILLQRAILGPLTKQLHSLLPRAISDWAQIFARGVVSQVGMLGGALLLLLLTPWLTPREIASLALGLSGWWSIEAIVFRRRYRSGLKQIMAQDGLDFDRCSEMAAGTDTAREATQPTLEAEEYPEEVLGLMEELDIPQLDPEVALGRLDHLDPQVRSEAAATFALSRDVRAVNRLVALLADTEAVRRSAMDALIRYGSGVLPVLEKALAEGPIGVQRSVLEVLRLAQLRDAETTPFLGRVLTDVYHGLIAARAIETLPAKPITSLLAAHLREKSREDLSLVFMTLWITHADMRLVSYMVHSLSAAAAVELLELSLDPAMAARLVPLVDSLPESERIARGRRVLPLLQSDSPERVLPWLCDHPDAVTRLLALCCLGEVLARREFFPLAERQAGDADPDLRQAARFCLHRCLHQEDTMPAIIQILQYLRGFAVFSGLGIRELRAIASIAEWTAYPAGAVLVKRGQPFAGLYLIIKGRVAMGQAADHPSGTIEPGSFFGDLELFASQPAGRDYAARDEVEALMIRTGHFLEIMKLYPLIGVNFCRYFAGKLQREGQPPPDTDRP